MTHDASDIIRSTAWRDGTPFPAAVTRVTDFGYPPERWYTVTVTIADAADGAPSEYSGTGPDAFAALEQARNGFEPHGFLLGVKGGSVHTWPSGACRDQGGGDVVYDYSTAKDGLAAHTVRTFSPAQYSELGTVAEQIASIETRYGIPTGITDTDEETPRGFRR